MNSVHINFKIGVWEWHWSLCNCQVGDLWTWQSVYTVGVRQRALLSLYVGFVLVFFSELRTIIRGPEVPSSLGWRKKKIDDFRFWLPHQKIIVWDVREGLEFFQAEKKLFHIGPKSLKIFGFFNTCYGPIFKNSPCQRFLILKICFNRTSYSCIGLLRKKLVSKKHCGFFPVDGVICLKIKLLLQRRRQKFKKFQNSQNWPKTQRNKAL